MNTRSHNDLILALQQITNIDNPNSTVQLKTWLSENGLATDTLGKKTVQKMMQTAPENIKEVLSLRLQVSKSSVKKYEAIRNSVCKDNRVHGMFMFYGANRTGRWSGRCVQLHNLVRNTLEPLEEARNLVKTGDYDAVKEKYPDVPDLLSQLIRTAFIAKPGYKFLVADYAQIEARVLSFLAGEEWRLKVFAENGDIYSATASNMFHVPVVKNGINGELRQRGKQSELSCGYGGGKGSLIAMGALDLGMKEEELQPLVDSWREANPNIVKFWWDVDKAAKEAVLYHQERTVGNIKFVYRNGMLFIELPSGRHLSYVKPRLEQNKFGSQSITYAGTDETKHWGRVETYGPKLVENITQAISRDILANAMSNLKAYDICAHVHDEVIIEAPEDENEEKVCEIMGKEPEWFKGIYIKAEGSQTKFYKKD